MTDDLDVQLARREAALHQLRTWLIRTMRLRREPDEIDPDTALFGGGLALDSVDAVDLVIGLETHFHVQADEARLQRALRTVNSLLDLILESEETVHAR
jgi:acyl carrier protein